MSKVMFILVDGLNLPAALHNLAYMRQLENRGDAAFRMLRCGLPPLSRPCYATLLTGMAAREHGFLCNEDNRPCPFPTIFSTAVKHGLITAAAAYHWMGELCKSLKPPLLERQLQRHVQNINYGLFYDRDDYPDDNLFEDAERLSSQFRPDFLLVHNMGVDDAGHKYGGASRQYNAAAQNVDRLLRKYVPVWLKDGYHIVLGSDHGMDHDGRHMNDNDICRQTPFWFMGAKWHASLLPTNPCQIADAILKILLD